MSYKKVTKFEQHKSNPYIESTFNHIEIGTKQYFIGQKSGDLIVDPETGEVKGNSLFARRVKVDKTQFTKVFINSIASWFELSKSAIRVFGYIVSRVKPNSDSFLLGSYEEAMEFTGYKSKNSILNGLSELLEYDFIARGYNNYHFFINPTIFFNGDRIAFLDVYEKENKNEFAKDSEKMLVGEFGKKADDEEKA